MKGTYIFFASLDSPKAIRINKKGNVHRFDTGWYAYVGSAFNTGGLKSRLNRHYLGTGNMHWHIDYFRKGVIPCDTAWINCETPKLEPVWAAVFQQLSGVSVPVRRFGNSDRIVQPIVPNAAASHLFHSNRKPGLGNFQRLLDRYAPGWQCVKEIRLPISPDIEPI